MEFKTAINHNIQIVPTHNNGFIVHAGCCTLAYKNTSDLMDDLADFLNDPMGAEAKYQKAQNDLDHLAPLPVQLGDRPKRSMDDIERMGGNM